MEVKDLLKDQLTENQEQELELQTRKDNYKKTQRYILTPEFRKLVKYFENKWEKVFEEIKTEITTRKKAEAVKSEIDKIVQDIEYYNFIFKKLWTHEWAKVFKNELTTRIINAESNLYIKVAPDELFDLPTYTKLDMLKMKRNSYLTVEKYLTLISEWFFDWKEGKNNPNPYEECWMTKEEFDALTKVD